MPRFAGLVETVCPFYLREAKRCILCRSVLDDADPDNYTVCESYTFFVDGAKEDHQRRYCFDITGYELCPRAAAILKKFYDK